jgi:hypothetical protein
MGALLTILTLFTITALIEFCVLHVWSQRRGLVFCITLVAAFSGIFWAAFLFTYLEATHATDLSRPVNTSPPVGSGDFWAIVMFLIYALIISVAALIPAGITAFLYKKFRRE